MNRKMYNIGLKLIKMGMIRMSRTEWQREELINEVVENLYLSDEKARSRLMEAFIGGYLQSVLETQIQLIREQIFNKDSNCTFTEACQLIGVSGPYQEEIRKTLLNSKDLWNYELIKACLSHCIKNHDLIRRAEQKQRRVCGRLLSRTIYLLRSTKKKRAKQPNNHFERAVYFYNICRGVDFAIGAFSAASIG